MEPSHFPWIQIKGQIQDFFWLISQGEMFGCQCD